MFKYFFTSFVALLSFNSSISQYTNPKRVSAYSKSENNHNVTVTTNKSFSEQLNESVHAGAASTQASAAAAASMDNAAMNITTPISVDLNSYSHLALVSVKYAGGSISKSNYKDMANDLIDSPFEVINPFIYDKEMAKKDKRFLRTIKNPNWLYYYYERSTIGYNQIRRVVVRDYNNKIIYNATGTNVPASKVYEPLVFAEVNNSSQVEREKNITE